MTQYHTQQLLDGLYGQTESFLNKAIEAWQGLPAEIMLRQPEPGKWSAAQCLAHLNSYGNYYLPAIENGIRKAGTRALKNNSTFKASWFGNYFTKMMMPEVNGKPAKKISSPKNHQPVKELDSNQVIAEFIDQQEKLLRLIQQSRGVDLRSIKIPISISKLIKLPLGDTFLFLVAHNYRHMLQAERALHAAAIHNQPVQKFDLAAIGMI